MITITHEKIVHIPSLLVSNEDRGPKPVIVYFHGFTSSKEQNLAQAYYLAEKGFLVILPDSYHHGERATETDSMKIQLDFWKIVSTNVSELHTIYAWLQGKNLMEEDKFGLAGTSMGGISTAAALTQYNWIQYAGIMMGSAKAQDMANYLIEQIVEQGIDLPFTDKELQEQMDSLKPIDLSQQLDRLNGRPLFVWHGEEDQVVPFGHSATFVEQILNRQPDYPLQYITEKGRDHKVSREAMLHLSNWLTEQVK